MKRVDLLEFIRSFIRRKGFMIAANVKSSADLIIKKLIKAMSYREKRLRFGRKPRFLVFKVVKNHYEQEYIKKK